MDLEECTSRQIVKRVRPDPETTKSLIQSSSNMLKSEELLKMSPITASSKLSLAYDSLRELLEALALNKGYKVYNHECYAAFLSEVIGAGEKGEEFDSVRRVRNAVNYYGKSVSCGEAAVVIARLVSLRSFVLQMLE